MSLIFYLSSQSPTELPSRDQLDWLGDYIDIVGHLVLFGVLGLLLLFTLWSWAGGSVERLLWVVAAISLSTVYGVLDEYHQSFVPLRSPSAFDVLVDSIGAGVSVVIGKYGLLPLYRRFVSQVSK